MDLQILGKNIEITDAIQNYAQKKMDRLSRYLSEISEAKIEVTEEKTRSPQDRYTAQITIRNKGHLLRAEERAPNINLAMDAVTDVLAGQIKKFKDKFSPKGKGNNIGQQIQEPSGKAPGFSLPSIVKNKRFIVKSMSIEEAEEQMELLSHDFFLFINEDSQALNLLYRRKDGNYGLIEPEYEAD